jgi:hypothetical protein
MPPLFSCLLLAPALVLGEHLLPVPLLVRIAVVPVERSESLHTSVPLSKVFSCRRRSFRSCTRNRSLTPKASIIRHSLLPLPSRIVRSRRSKARACTRSRSATFAYTCLHQHLQIQIPLQQHPIQNQQRRPGLVLGGGSNMTLHRQVREIGVLLRAAHPRGWRSW